MCLIEHCSSVVVYRNGLARNAHVNNMPYSRHVLIISLLRHVTWNGATLNYEAMYTLELKNRTMALIS